MQNLSYRIYPLAFCSFIFTHKKNTKTVKSAKLRCIPFLIEFEREKSAQFCSALFFRVTAFHYLACQLIIPASNNDLLITPFKRGITSIASFQYSNNTNCRPFCRTGRHFRNRDGQEGNVREKKIARAAKYFPRTEVARVFVPHTTIICE